jgi:hypothetical protein
MHQCDFLQETIDTSRNIHKTRSQYRLSASCRAATEGKPPPSISTITEKVRESRLGEAVFDTFWSNTDTE